MKIKIWVDKMMLLKEEEDNLGKYKNIDMDRQQLIEYV